MEKYNGWTNYETWKTQLELIDGLDLTEYFEEEPDTREVADFLKSLVEESLYGRGDMSSFVASLVNDFVRQVNFMELAENLIDSADYSQED